MSGRWLSVVGIGEDGIAGLSAAARLQIETAAHVFGGARHLALAEGVGVGARHVWDNPIADSIARIAALRGQRVCVLASGDPFLFGVGATLARQIPAGEMDVFPAPSALSLAAARLGWSLQEVAFASLLTRPVETIRPLLHKGRRVLVLVPDADGPARLAVYLDAIGFGETVLTVLEALGGPDERIRSARARGFELAGISALNLVALEVGETSGLVIPLTPGLPDDAFDHDGQITKSDMRALTLAALAPRHGERLWDIGAGSGSVGIEWMLRHPSLAAVAIEADPERAARIGANALALGVPGLDLVIGHAPAVLDGLSAPDAIFIGGGASDDGMLDATIAALRPGGRLVVNGVTLETEAILIAAHGARGGTLRRIALSRAEPIGTMTGWRPAMPVTQWVWHKEG